MEDKTCMIPPFNSKYIIRKTGEEVEIIDSEIRYRGDRSEYDWVTYIDFNGNEHIKEHLNLQLDFKPVVNDTWNKLFDLTKSNKYPSTINIRKFEVAKELVVNKNMTVSEAVAMADALVKQIGIEFD